jgi:predicted  nucleic acid-binding Zn-ribbon protein
MLKLFRRRRALRADRTACDLQRRILDLEAQLDAAKRKLAIAEDEIEALGEVIVRDRQRVLAETSEASQRISKAESKDKPRGA